MQSSRELLIPAGFHHPDSEFLGLHWKSIFAASPCCVGIVLTAPAAAPHFRGESILGCAYHLPAVARKQPRPEAGQFYGISSLKVTNRTTSPGFKGRKHRRGEETSGALAPRTLLCTRACNSDQDLRRARSGGRGEKRHSPPDSAAFRLGPRPWGQDPGKWGAPPPRLPSSGEWCVFRASLRWGAARTDTPPPHSSESEWRRAGNRPPCKPAF